MQQTAYQSIIIKHKNEDDINLKIAELATLASSEASLPAGL
jgi:hypothetical protein